MMDKDESQGMLKIEEKKRRTYLGYNQARYHSYLFTSYVHPVLRGDTTKGSSDLAGGNLTTNYFTFYISYFTKNIFRNIK